MQTASVFGLAASCVVLGAGEGGPAPECWVLGSCVDAGLEDWRHTCLGFCPRSTAAWTVTLESLVPPGPHFPALYNIQIARW